MRASVRDGHVCNKVGICQILNFCRTRGDGSERSFGLTPVFQLGRRRSNLIDSKGLVDDGFDAVRRNLRNALREGAVS